jgi:hypothetical protein
VPEALVACWVSYTNLAATAAGIEGWEPTSLPEIYIWLAILIYIGIHKESSFRNYWKASTAEDYNPTHPITKLMTYQRFQQLRVRIRICSLAHLHTHKHDAFQCVEDWSVHVQIAALNLYIPGTNVAVDETMIAFTGKSKLKLTITTKPTPTGFKMWVIAQRGYFLGWLPHRPHSKFGPAGRPKRKVNGQPALNPTQSVVPLLVKKLPSANYHVYVDNLFSSPQLFEELRKEGHGATGTARTNCGLFKQLIEAKVRDKQGKCWRWNELRAYATVSNKVSDLGTVSLGNPLLTSP